eukprot:492250_1
MNVLRVRLQATILGAIAGTSVYLATRRDVYNNFGGLKNELASIRCTINPSLVPRSQSDGLPAHYSSFNYADARSSTTDNWSARVRSQSVSFWNSNVRSVHSGVVYITDPRTWCKAYCSAAKAISKQFKE